MSSNAECGGIYLQASFQSWRQNVPDGGLKVYESGCKIRAVFALVSCAAARIEALAIQKFIAKPCVERLVEAVLPPTASRDVDYLRAEYGVSERLACRVLGKHCSTQRN
jgi:hypothetical protein